MSYLSNGFKLPLQLHSPAASLDWEGGPSQAVSQLLGGLHLIDTDLGIENDRFRYHLVIRIEK